MARAGKVALAVVGLVIGVIAVGALREATLSTHDVDIPPGSQIELVVSAHTRHSEADQSLAELVEAQVLACRLEVNSDVQGKIEAQGENRFRAVLTPSMDETNRRQFRGCLEDWVIDSLRLDVERLAEVEPHSD
jgi:hypothetical protein